MPKGKQDDELELDFGNDGEREFTGSDANPKNAATGESLFDDLSPRFVRQLDAAAEAATHGKKPAKQAASEEEDLDPSDDGYEDERDEEEEDADEQDQEDEPEQADADEEEEDEDADEPRPGRKLSPVEKRLARASRIAEEARAQVAIMQQREQQREARANLAASENEYNTFKADTERKLAELKDKKVKAIEDGDTAAHVDIDDQITDLKSELRSRTREFEQAKKDVEESTKRRGASEITLIKVGQWKRKNPRYERDPIFAAAVNALDKKLVSEGSNPESDEHYRKIDRELKKTFPDHKVPGERAARRHPSQQLNREAAPAQRRQAGDARVQVKGNKIRISPAKLARIKENMVRFGFDPNNKRDLQDYILNNPGL